MHPKVSVIIPTYNRANYLRSAIQSVLNQTFKDLEIIVVDDASTDNTRQVVHEIVDDRIHYIAHKKNRGGARAKNTGIKNSEGEFIAFLDDDDLWIPTKLEKQLGLLNMNPEISVVYTGAWDIDKDGKVGRPLENPSLRGNIYPIILKKNYVVCDSGALVKKECFDVTGLFDENLPCNQDWDLWIRMAKHFQFDYINETLVLYRIHERRISSDPYRKLLGIRLMFKKFSKELHASNHKKILAFWHYKFGKLYCKLGDMKEARKEFFKAIIKSPLSITYYIRLSTSFFGKRIYDIVTKFLDSALPASFKHEVV